MTYSSGSRFVSGKCVREGSMWVHANATNAYVCVCVRAEARIHIMYYKNSDLLFCTRRKYLSLEVETSSWSPWCCMFAALIITRHKALSSTTHVSVEIRRERKQSYKFHQGIHLKIFKMLKGEIFSCAASYGCESGLSRRLALVSLDQFSPSVARLFLLSIKRTEQVATLTCMIFNCVQLQGSVKGFPPCDHE